MGYDVSPEQWKRFSTPRLKDHTFNHEESMSGIVAVYDTEVETLMPLVDAYIAELEPLISETDNIWMKNPGWWKLWEALNRYGPRVQWASTELNSNEAKDFFDGQHCINMFPYATFTAHWSWKGHEGYDLRFEHYINIKQSINRQHMGSPFRENKPANAEMHRQFLNNARKWCAPYEYDLARILNYMKEGRCAFEFHVEDHMMAIVCHWMHQQMKKKTFVADTVYAQFDLMNVYPEWTWDTFMQAVEMMVDACNHNPSTMLEL